MLISSSTWKMAASWNAAPMPSYCAPMADTPRCTASKAGTETPRSKHKCPPSVHSHEQPRSFKLQTPGKDGRIVERGTHAELLRANGRYAAMYGHWRAVTRHG